MAGPPLPPEMYRDILARMPVKSVLRCRSVSKSCCSLISSPDFISHHSITNLHNNNRNRLLLKLEYKCGDLLCSSHDESGMESCELNYDDHCDFLGRYLQFVGSCDGLICLSEITDFEYGSKPDTDGYSAVTFLIWNPAIRKIVELPSLEYCYCSQDVSLAGFGFDSNTSDYKVMCNLRKRWSSETDDCVVFHLSKGVWRRISPLVPPPTLYCPAQECYVDGAVHWSLSRDVNGIGGVILSFNMSDESFREIGMPDFAEFTRSGDDDRIRTRCFTFDGLVHLLVWKIEQEQDDYVVDLSESCSVWAMKEYGVTKSWTKVANIDLLSALVFPTSELCPRYFILWVKHEVLMMPPPVDEDLFSFNTGSEHVQDICQYEESLALFCSPIWERGNPYP